MDIHRHARTQRPDGAKVLRYANPNGHTLNDLREVPCGVIGREERELGARCRGETFHDTFGRRPTIGIDVDRDWLPDANVRKLRLLHVRGDENAGVRYDREQRLARGHQLPDFDLLTRDNPRSRCRNMSVAELELGVLARGPRGE